MTDPNNPFNYPLNPDFGKGVFRRRIRITHIENGVYAELEDCNHGFVITVLHDGDNITDIFGEARRIPLNSCTGAMQPLKQLIGSSIAQSAKSLAASINPRENCTHWLDLSLLAIQHINKPEPVSDYLIEVPDEDCRAVAVKLFLNNELQLNWQLQDWIILQPENLQGKTLYKGFSQWANELTDEDEKTAAFVLQKAYFVSRARRFDIANLGGEAASKHTMMHGACYSYSEPRLSYATRTHDTIRDFTDCPEQLLKFR